MSVKLGFNTHGKGRVRLVKVTREASGRHSVQQLSVQILLEGYDMADVYLTGDNGKVVATDTCKNTVYCLAKENDFSSIEEFAMILCNHFLAEYPSIVSKACISILQDDWKRLETTDSSGRASGEHLHAFRRFGPTKLFTEVHATVDGNSRQPMYSIKSGLKEVELMKTTQSGFVGFHRNKFTSLPEDDDRLLGTSAEMSWSFDERVVNNKYSVIDFNKIAADAEKALIETFAGPSDKGVYSASVQATLYNIGKAVLAVVPAVNEVTLQMPNIHNIAFPLEKYNIKNADHTGKPSIFFPIDEPHGMIKASVVRTRSRL